MPEPQQWFEQNIQSVARPEIAAIVTAMVGIMVVKSVYKSIKGS